MTNTNTNSPLQLLTIWAASFGALNGEKKFPLSKPNLELFEHFNGKYRLYEENLVHG